MLNQQFRGNLDPLDLLSRAEHGDAREIVSDHCQSPSRRSGIKTLFFIKNDNPSDFILSRDSMGAEFVMFARLDEDRRVCNIFHRKPADPQFSENRPDFRLSWDENHQFWSVCVCSDSLICDKCLYRSRNVSVINEKPTILSIEQGMQTSEKGDHHWFYMDIEGVSTEFGDRAVECRRCRNGADSSPIGNHRGSFSIPSDSISFGRPPLRLKSVIPSLTKTGELSIRFLTRDRSVLPSARNMQISGPNPEGVNEIVFQFIKISALKFNIDFRAPLSPIQAFCIALSTNYWK
jgi:hypothetical protein